MKVLLKGETRDAMAVLGSGPTPTFREDENGSVVWICMHVFGNGFRNKQRQLT